jgi:1,4-dihydroxy-2-naphthoyl-CoA hydrolase
VSEFVAMMPFAAALGIRITSADTDEVVGELDHAADRTTAGGAIHGGALMALADSVGAVCAFLNLPAGATTSTTSSHTVFLRAVRGGTVTATARPVHVGRSSIVVSTDVCDSGKRPVARTTQTQAVLGPQ